jgi:hypothetical protein
VSALQWAAATVACTRTGYPKVHSKHTNSQINDLTFQQPGDISVPPVIRKLQLQSVTLAAVAADMSAHDKREQDFGNATGDRRPLSVLFNERLVSSLALLSGDCLDAVRYFFTALLHPYISSRSKKRNAAYQ